MNFEELIKAINDTHNSLHKKALSSINKYLTMRNWLIGYYIVEFEQNGEDRAKYGQFLLAKISERLDIKGFSITNLKLFRQFYFVYPQIAQLVFGELNNIEKSIFALEPIRILNQIGQLPTDLFKNKNETIGISPYTVINELSFTHLVELLKIDEDLKRAFYEIECLKGNWSVKELRRQIGSLYFERMGLSKDKEKLSEYTQNKSITLAPADVIQSPFFFEFLGFKDKDVIKESDLEDGLIDKLSEFILELGHGFCFENRQKRITIGDEYYFIDLVFYHRILKCHVLIELKNEEFNHENIGQLNTYLNYYKKNIMQGDDNPPVGILLCTKMNHSLVEYATAGMDNQLFVSKYLLALPSKEELEKFINNEINKRE